MSVPAENRPYSLTVVIPTLGGDCLRETVETLNRGSVTPDEILICIPADFAHRVDLTAPNVRVVATECKGQVAQRAVGFRIASSAFVMQLDDDLLVDRDCVRYLLKALQRHGPKAAVSPSLVDRESGRSIYRKPDRSRVIDAIYNLLMNGTTASAQGKVLKSGGAVGVDPEAEGRDSYRVEWVPGGCVMHHRDNLVLDDFYPLKGKAYCEDIIHSHHLTSKGVTPYIEPRALCSVEAAPDSDLTFRDFLRSVVADYHARRYFMRLTSRNPLRLSLFLLARLVGYAGGRLARVRRPEVVKS